MRVIDALVSRFFEIAEPPTWAYSWCWIYMIVTIFSFVLLVGTVFANLKKLNLISILAILIGTGIQFVHGMTYFWMCRASLKSYSA